MLVNVSATPLNEAQLAPPLRVYVQTDPVTSELRLANGDEYTREAFDAHHAILTYGENYGAPDCGVPLNDVRYGKTRQPVDVELWPFTFDREARYFTTIGNYRQDGWQVEHEGETYTWSKHLEWEKFMELPSRTDQPFEVALNFDDPADRERVESRGWRGRRGSRFAPRVFGAYTPFLP